MAAACIGTRRPFSWAALSGSQSLAQAYSLAAKALECGDMRLFAVELTQKTGRG